MPRLNGEEYVPGPAVPEGAKPSDEVFVVAASGEGVRRCGCLQLVCCRVAI